jgi:phosphoenolpyruvate-protein phosphotransferase
MTVAATRITGVAAAGGVARGRWTSIVPDPLPEPRRITANEVEPERERLREAIRAVARELLDLSAAVREGGHPDEAAIFTAQAAMARDPDLFDGAAAEIERDGVDAGTAVARAACAIADRIAALDDELLRGRATDVNDVGDRIARRLAGLPAVAGRLDAPAIVVADDLAPAVTATLPRDLVLGIALERSSPTAHAAILARAYGIPAVVGAIGLLEALQVAGPGTEIALDGSSGEVVVGPDAAEAARFDALAARAADERARDLREATDAALTSDGVEIALMANIGNPDECELAIALGARGVGLFRTEFLFLERSQPPSEEEQVEAYRQVVEAFPGQPVTVRLLDIGGDKPIPYLPMDREDNPMLGIRALRLAERHPELFVTQLRACLRAATAGPIRVMAPMVADATDVDTLHALAERARAELADEGLQVGEIELGVMLEIPSAVLTLAAYADRIAFASLGTNDLLQYALAVDRGNAGLERYRDPMHPGLLRLVRLSAEASEPAAASLSVCGEMAGDPVAALALIGLGVRALSMSASSLPAVRRAIRAASAHDLARRATEACAEPSAAAARARFEPAD